MHSVLILFHLKDIKFVKEPDQLYFSFEICGKEHMKFLFLELFLFDRFFAPFDLSVLNQRQLSGNSRWNYNSYGDSSSTASTVGPFLCESLIYRYRIYCNLVPKKEVAIILRDSKAKHKLRLIVFIFTLHSGVKGAGLGGYQCVDYWYASSLKRTSHM
jgi:hypothetical protein